jgi:F-type H+-transporting ATPase subunit delta
MKHSRVARRYARALMAAAEHQKNIDGVAKDLEIVGKVLDESKELRLLVASPVVSPARKRSVLAAVFVSRIGSQTLTFMNLLTTKSREEILRDVVDEFRVLHDDQLGIVNVHVRTAVELSYAQEKELRSLLEHMLNRKPRLHMVIDKEIKGGLVVRIGDRVLDASVARQLDRMREQFVAGRAA